MDVAFLGLGAMGSRMAANLLKAGLRVTVWNRSRDAVAPLAALGAAIAASPKAAASVSDVVVSMVRDDAAARRVWLDPDDGALRGTQPGASAIESSTLSPSFVAELAAACAEREVAFLDAPVAGSRPQAESAQLVFLIGGAAETVERLRPVLDAMGSSIHHVGPTGHGAFVKLAVNAMLVAEVAALAELAGLLDRVGVDVRLGLEALNATAVGSPALKGAAASMLSRQYAPLFPIELAAKDCAYARAAAAAAGSAVPVMDAVRGVLSRATEAGFAHEHLTAIAKIFR